MKVENKERRRQEENKEKDSETTLGEGRQENKK